MVGVDEVVVCDDDSPAHVSMSLCVSTSLCLYVCVFVWGCMSLRVRVGAGEWEDVPTQSA